jgi:trk system potassium uptake protein TrkA
MPLRRPVYVRAVHFVIMGCGRVGATLAHSLEEQGHDVAVIDRDESAFRRLGATFEGRRVTGVGFDRDTQLQAGIEDAYAFAAVSSGDNSNILAARVARETFGVANVVARIYDPGRAEIYQRLGIPTVATVRWTADRLLRRLLPVGAAPLFRDPSGKVVLAEVPVHKGWIGRPVDEVAKAGGNLRVAYLSRFGEGIVPTSSTVFQDGDLLHVVAEETELPRIESLLDTPPPED